MEESLCVSLYNFAVAGGLNERALTVDWIQSCFPLDCLWSRNYPQNTPVCSWSAFEFPCSDGLELIREDPWIVLHTLRHSTRPHRPQVRKKHFNTKNHLRDFAGFAVRWVLQQSASKDVRFTQRFISSGQLATTVVSVCKLIAHSKNWKRKS